MKARIIAATLLVCLLLTGCSADSQHQVQPVSSETAQEATDIFASFQELLDTNELTYRSHGTFSFDNGLQTTDLIFNTADDAFEGEILAEVDGQETALSIIRTHTLTWIKGPPEYWESLGYEPDRAADKYVVFTADRGNEIAQSYNANRILESIQVFPIEDVQVVGKVEDDRGQHFRYQLGYEETATSLDLLIDGNFDSVRILSGSNDVDASLVLSDFGVNTNIEPPSPDQVVQP